MPKKFRKVYNLLLTGKTGAGKSTFINSISNFFLHETLTDALADTLPSCVIHSQFTLTFRDSNRIQKSITVSMPGVDRTDYHNERFESDGASCTLEPRVYSFSCKGIEFNVIDVPGLADTAGSNQDKINKLAIIKQVGRFTEIHGICIVISATEARITTELKYCLNEIMSSLNKSAIKNIMFVVTNSATHQFTSGLADQPIKAYIKELNTTRNLSLDFDSNVFCIDNDAFRFLIGWNQSSEFRQAHENKISKYEESWSESREAVFDLFKRLYTMNTHRTEDTMSVARASTVIQCIIPSLSVVTGRIAVADTKEYKKKMLDSLMGNGTMEKPDVQVQDQESPQLVCTHKACLKKSIDPKTNHVFFDFSNPCHENCYIKGVAKAGLGDPVLKQCQKIDMEDNCRTCSHNYKHHMHVPYRVTKTTSKVDTGTNNPFTREEAEKRYDLFIKGLKQENAAILGETIKLANFLKNNAIIEYNTAFEDQLTVEMQTEQLAGNISAVKNVQESIGNYKRQMAIIDASKSNKISDIGIADVEKSLDKLFTLPLYGKTIQNLYEKELPPSEAADPHEFIKCRVKYIPDM